MKSQYQSGRSQRWFDLDFGWIEENFSTREPDLYKKIYQRHHETQDTSTFKMFVDQISNAKNVEEIKFHINAPMLKYRQNSSNSCCFSNSESSFEIINQTKDSNAISKHIYYH